MRNTLLISGLLIFFFILIHSNTSYAQEENLLIEQTDEDTREVFDDMDLALKTPDKVQILNLSTKGLSIFPKGLNKLVNLEELYLNDNKFSSIDAELFALKKLKKLDISGNQVLANIPAEITALTSLEYIKFGNNESLDLSQIFSTLGKLPNLKIIDLMECKIRTIPIELGNLTQIKELFLTSNRILTIPPEIGKLNNLEILDISANQLTTLPSELSKLPKLKEIYIDGNQLSDDEISKIKKMLPKCTFDL